MRKGAVIVMLLLLCPSEGWFSQDKGGLPPPTGAFVPPGSSILKLNKYDPATGRVVSSRPAVVPSHILSGTSDDIVFAYGTPRGKSYQSSLFVSLLHRTSSGYVKVFDVTYYARTLASQGFQTVGLQVIQAPGSSAGLVAVATEMGASLGASIQVFRWDRTWGMTNVMPSNGGVHHFEFAQQGKELTLTLAFGKYEGDKAAPPPRTFEWSGKNFMPLK